LRDHSPGATSIWIDASDAGGTSQTARAKRARAQRCADFLLEIGNYAAGKPKQAIDINDTRGYGRGQVSTIT
jgi:hypothetical protein